MPAEAEAPRLPAAPDASSVKPASESSRAQAGEQIVGYQLVAHVPKDRATGAATPGREVFTSGSVAPVWDSATLRATESR